MESHMGHANMMMFCNDDDIYHRKSRFQLLKFLVGIPTTVPVSGGFVWAILWKIHLFRMSRMAFHRIQYQETN